LNAFICFHLAFATAATNPVLAMHTDNEQTRKAAVDAVDILNDFIGDLVSGTMLFRYWINESQQGHIQPALMITIQKICISHLVLALSKFTEFYQRFLWIIPLKHRQACKTLLNEIDRKGVVDFRNKCVGHIWDNDQQRPLMNSEIMTRLDRLTDGDMIGFLNWINPTPNELPSSVVRIVETVRDDLTSDYSISPNDFLQR